MNPIYSLVGIANIVIPYLIIACLFSYVISRFLAHFAHKLSLIDKPNGRSSHHQPVPRGGGVAVLIAFITSISMVRHATGQPIILESQAFTIIFGSAVIGVIGLTDDVRGLSPSLRLLLQAVLASLTIFALGPLSSNNVPIFSTLPTWILGPLTFLGLVWWLNLYNFMDGLDGLASCQTLFMCGSGLIGVSLTLLLNEGVPSLTGQTSSTLQYLLNAKVLEFAVLGASSLGFLIINWHPARIFLGDSGSLSQGYLLFTLAMFSIGSGSLTYQFWLIVGAAFVVDSTHTLLIRAKKKAQLSAAHREHTYQKLFDHRRLSQTQVTLLYCLINLLFLLPLALCSLVWDHYSDLFVMSAYALMVALNLAVRKGTP